MILRRIFTITRSAGSALSLDLGEADDVPVKFITLLHECRSPIAGKPVVARRHAFHGVPLSLTEGVNCRVVIILFGI